MSIFLATILAISATPSQAAPEATAPASQVTPAVAARTGRELSEAAHAAMRQWAKATDQEAETAARELLGIYREILQDTRMARSQHETLRVTVRARLDQLCTQIGKRIAKDKAAAKENTAVKSVAADKSRQGSTILAGVGVAAGGGAGLGGGAANGQNANADNGPALVELIQTTICPKSWDVNGGSCTISYWQQQHAIVVRATGDVHGEISDTLEQLNRATH